MIRGGHIDVSILGAYQVAGTATWRTGSCRGSASRGWAGRWTWRPAARRVIVMMTHVSKRGEPKLLRRCTLPLTGQAAST